MPSNPPESPQAEAKPSAADQSLVPFRRVRELATYEVVRSLLDATATKVSTSPRATMTTSFVLFAIADAGQVDDPPTWAADFLARHIRRDGSKQAEVRRAYYDRQGVKDKTKRSVARQDLMATRYLLTDFHIAARIAEDTTGKPIVCTRHLLAGLLRDREDPEPSGAHRRLQEMGLDIAEMRQALLSFVVGWDDDDAAWERWLTSPSPIVQRLLSFAADSGQGQDLIGIERDVLALATLIAARQVTPPLSVGLFGEWGSGKTFFMRKLQAAVSTLAKQARNSGSMQRDQAFYKRIVQIEFNAWHYVEGNLWASLVEHIFDNLKVGGQDDDTVTEKLQRKLLDELKFQESAADAAREQEAAARAAVNDADRDLRTAATERDRKRDELTALKTHNLLAQFSFTDLHRQLTPVLAALDLDAVGSAATDLSHALHRAEGVLQEAGSVLGPLLHAKDRGLRWVKLGVVALGPLAVASVTTVLLSLDGLPRVASFMTALAGGLAFLARWIGQQAAWVQGHLRRVHDIQNEYDRQLKAALADNERRIAAAAQDLEEANAAYTSARHRRESAEKAYEDARRNLEAATSVKLLASFIQDRASSTDYRKHLGLLALVRDDFERLSGLIEDENWRLAPAVDGEPPRKSLRKFESLVEEEHDIDARINRIVLYIDDLDRCPPGKVVEVLQAVHLLLAFPLFVVVVGVDARWITSSLRSRYRELLHDDIDEAETDIELIGRATAQDYLEKIFQIPFWIESMDDRDCRRMVHGLLGSSVVREPAPTETVSDDGGRTAAESSSESKADYAAQEESPNDRVGEAPPTPNVESLDIHAEEVAAMNDLAPLLGRSPRALKRFVNVYRLVKASLSPVEYRVFIQPDGGAYRSVLFLLAVDSGAPAAAPAVFRALAAHAGTNPIPALVKALEIDPDDGTMTSRRMAADRQRMRDWLRGQSRVFLGDGRQLSTWVARVRRYSFGSEAAEAIRPMRIGQR